MELKLRLPIKLTHWPAIHYTYRDISLINLHCKDKHLSSPAWVKLGFAAALSAKATEEQPGWDFPHYLINRNGLAVSTFTSDVLPHSPEVSQAIRRALDAHPITEQ